jgi:hypothetical protein
MIDLKTVAAAAILAIGLAGCNDDGVDDVEGTGADAVEVPIAPPVAEPVPTE